MRPLAILASLLLAGCSTEEPAAATPTTLQGTLSLEIRDTASVTIEQLGPQTSVLLTVSNGHGVLPAETVLRGAARIDRFPEAEALLYTARFDVAPQVDGPCADKPLSAALSLHRDADNARVSGSLTAYCGGATWYGVPVKVLRLAGTIPLQENP